MGKNAGQLFPIFRASIKIRSHLQPLKWPQVAAPDNFKRVAASGCKWPLSTISISPPPKATPLTDHVFSEVEEGYTAIGSAQRIVVI